MVSHIIDFPDHSGTADGDQKEAPRTGADFTAAPSRSPISFNNEQLDQAIAQNLAGMPDVANIIGAVDRVESNIVVGWAADLDRVESPVIVELLLDGTVAATCLAGQERPDVAAKKPGVSPYCGFRLAALHDLSEETVHLAVRVAGGPELPQRAGFRHGRKVRDGMHTGSVAQVSGSTIWGWVNTDTGSSHPPIEIDAYIDGEWVCSAQSTRKTSLSNFDSHTSRRAFVIDLPRSRLAEGADHVISLRRRDGGELANSPLRFSSNEGFDEADKLLAPEWIEPAPPQITLLGTQLGCLRSDERSAAACGEQSRRALEALWFFGRLVGIDPGELLVRQQDCEQRWFVEGAEVFSKQQDDVQPVLDSAIAIDDLWLLGDGGLRLRSSAQLSAAASGLRLFQVDAERHHLVEIGRSASGPDRLLCSAVLLNTFFPVLVIALGEDESIEGCAVIPFPSLCRGGTHYSELRGEGEFPDYLTALRRMSRSLVQEYLGWRNSPPFAIGKLLVDLHGATGAERVFSDEFKAWLAFYFHLQPQPADLQVSLPPEASEHLENALHFELPDVSQIKEAIAARNSGGKSTLTIPADAIPTLAALVSRRLRLSDNAGAQAGSYVLADDGTCSPRLLVSIPFLEGSFRSLQPANAPLAFPLLARSAAAKSADSDESLKAPVLAIRFQATWHANDSALLYPSAISSPVFRRTMTAEERESIVISVIVRLSAATAATAQLLRSIANQTIADRMEIIAVARSGNPPPDEAVQALAEHFSGRYQLLTDDSAPASQLNGAAGCAKGTHLLFIDDAIILHDPRTIEALSLMTIEERVASAACVTVQEKPHGKSTTLSLAYAGFLPARVSFSNAPNLVFSEMVPPAAMPIATYPVVSNAFRLALVRTSAWKELGGLDATTFPISNFDLEFGLRAIKAGYLHFCTSATTAAYLGGALSGERADVLSLAYLPTIQWQSVFNSSAVIRELN